MSPFLKYLFRNNSSRHELEDEYGLRLSGRSSVIEINVDLWEDFTIEYIQPRYLKYCKESKNNNNETTDNELDTFVKLTAEQLKNYLTLLKFTWKNATMK